MWVPLWVTVTMISMFIKREILSHCIYYLLWVKFENTTTVMKISINCKFMLNNYNFLPLLMFIVGDICPEGYYCEVGSSMPTPCGNGTYMNHTGASACYTCPAGYYCVNRDRADICTQGYYCPTGTGADLQPCPTGSFGNTTGLIQESECTPCTGKIIYLNDIVYDLLSGYLCLNVFSGLGQWIIIKTF